MIDQPAPPRTLIAALDDLALVVEFTRVADRHEHSISLQRDGRSTTLLTSLEGDDQDEWPPSPPLQNLSIEDHGAGPTALLVGMAGVSHWSAAVDTDGQGLTFDIACRTSRDPIRLGSAYRWLQKPPTNLDERSLQLDMPDGQGRLTLILEHGSPFAPSKWSCNEDSLRAEVGCAAITGKTTLRWKYHLRVV